MTHDATKHHPTIGCCGIDCGLCPRYYTRGTSRCPGCAGKGFAGKHPTCAILTCCSRRGLETCGTCDDFPCDRVKRWDSADSFVTHRTCIANLHRIREDGMTLFLAQQAQRMQLLDKLLEQVDDGRSKSFFCLSTALLPVAEMQAAARQLRSSPGWPHDRAQLCRLLRQSFSDIATANRIELSYRRKT